MAQETEVTIDLTEAAQFLGVHRETAREWAASGKIPGAKIGKDWRFLPEDLKEYVRSQYRREECHSISKVVSTMSTSSTRDAELDALLAPRIKRKPRSITTSSKPPSGERRDLAKILHLLPPGKTQQRSG